MAWRLIMPPALPAAGFPLWHYMTLAKYLTIIVGPTEYCIAYYGVLYRRTSVVPVHKSGVQSKRAGGRAGDHGQLSPL